MDDLDREIAEAARLARRRVWRGRAATVASTATFLVVGVVGAVVSFKVFPEPVNESDTQRMEMKADHEEPGGLSVAGDVAAEHVRWRLRLIPVIALAFGSALFVSRRLKPSD